MNKFKTKNKKPKPDSSYNKAECIVVKLCPLSEEEIPENVCINLAENNKTNFLQKIIKFLQKICH